MKLLALKVAEVCCDLSNNWAKYDDAHFLRLFEEVRCCCEPPLDRLATAEVLAVHSVTAGKHQFHSMLLQWVTLPDFDRQAPLCGPSCHGEFSCNDSADTAVAGALAARLQDKIADDQDTPNCGAARRRSLSSHIADVP